jgi:hypothetical protein
MSKKTMRKFDCVEFKRRVQSEIYEETKHMSPQEQIAYFRDRAESGSLGSWWESLKRVSTSRKPMEATAK